MKLLFKIFFLVILGIILYASIFHAPFCYDDELLIVQNLPLHNLSQGFTSLQRIWDFQPSRFLTNLTLALNYQAGGLDVFGYHLMSWMIHLATVFGVWYLTHLVLRLRFPKFKVGIDIAFVAGLLFLVHPINTEAVSYINQRSTALATLFYLWSLIFYVKVRTGGAHPYFVGAVIFAVLALLSKEIAVTLPLAWLLADYFISRRGIPKLIWWATGFALIAVGLFFDFKYLAMFSGEIYSHSHEGDVLTLSTYLLTQLRVLVVFLRLIVLPLSQNVDYDFAMSYSLWEGPTVASLIFLSGLLFAAYQLRQKDWIWSFAIFWFFISLLSHILPARANVIAEHKLYLTLSLLIPVICIGLSSYLSRRVLMAGMIFLIIVFSSLTFLRNQVWADPIRLWQDTIDHSPAKARPQLNLGVAYFRAGRLDEALLAYQKTILISPRMGEAYTNISELYSRRGDLSKAMNFAEQAIALDGQNALAYMQKGILYAQVHQDQNAIDTLNKALSLNGNLREIYKMRGLLNARLNRNTEAIADYQVWLSWSPQDEQIQSELLRLTINSDRH